MTDGYREYLELYEYFGRGGTSRLRRDEFEDLAAELQGILSLERPLTKAEAARFVRLQQLLFRERPRLSELLVAED